MSALEKARAPWLAFVCVFILLWLPSWLLLDPSPVWDDSLFIQAYLLHPLSSSIKPFALGSVSYWRPLSTFTMAIPIEMLKAWGEAWFMLAGKAASLAMFLGIGLGAAGLGASRLPRSGAGLAAIMGALLALHPMMAEPAMWLSDRFDLLMCAWALALFWLVEDSKSGVWIALLFGVGACLTKESGHLWAAGAAALALGRRRRRVALGLGAGLGVALAARALALSVMPFSFFDKGVGFSGAWSWDLAASGLGRVAIFALAPWTDDSPLHFSSDFSWSWIAGLCLWAALAGLLVMAWTSRRAAGSLWGWAALALGVVAAQCALVAFVDPTLSYPAFWMRYAAPSFVLALVLGMRVASKWGLLGSSLILALAVSLTAASAPVALGAKLAFASPADLWGAVHASHPGQVKYAEQYCAELAAVGEWPKAREVARRWIELNPGKRSAKIEALVEGSSK